MFSKVAVASRWMLLVGLVVGALMLGLNQISVPVAKAGGSSTTLEDTSEAGPALAVFNGRLYIAWTGTDSEQHLNVLTSSDGVNFGTMLTLGESSIAGPALATSGPNLSIAWTGTDDAGHLNVAEL